MSSFRFAALSEAPVAEVVEVINAAYDDWRRLPRVDAYVAQDPPPVSVESLSAGTERGDVCPEASVVCMDGDTVIGVATVGFNGTAHRARLGWVAVLPAYRRRGAGRELLLHAMEQARARGCREIITARFIDSRYLPAVHLLESTGFVWANPERCNVTMVSAIDKWEPREICLPPGFTIRTWQDGDELAWTQVKRAAFEDDTPVGWWSRTFGSRHDFDPRGWHLCEYQGQVVAIAAAVVTRHPETGDVMGCCIEWVGVLPEFRGLGLGRAIVTACLNYAKQFRPDPVVIVTQPNRKRAVALYESLGFRTVRQWREYLAIL
ncbi:MAG: GNAT family N-acetyltransferase [Armatimonadetes bacterium]|nr:GNAT family N-acetyltransferase [Armatimonadota bacterium]